MSVVVDIQLSDVNLTHQDIQTPFQWVEYLLELLNLE